MKHKSEITDSTWEIVFKNGAIKSVFLNDKKIHLSPKREYLILCYVIKHYEQDVDEDIYYSQPRSMDNMRDM